MKRKNSNKLTLKTKTVRTLDARSLGRIIGAADAPTRRYGCYPTN